MADTSVPDDEKRRVEADFVQRLQEQMQQLSVYDHLVGILQTFSSLAFQHLGLTRESADQRDLDQSRLAIEAFRALTEVLAPLRPSDEVGLYRSTLSQMQLAYVAELERDRAPEEPSETRDAAAVVTDDTDVGPTAAAAEAEVGDDTDAEPDDKAAADAVDDTATDAGEAPLEEER